MYGHQGTEAVTLPGWLLPSSEAPSKRETSDRASVCISLSTAARSHPGLMARLLGGHLGPPGATWGRDLLSLQLAAMFPASFTPVSPVRVCLRLPPSRAWQEPVSLLLFAIETFFIVR